MDRREIEALIERLGDESTRREGLKAALAVLFGAGAVAAGDGRETDAKSRKRRRKRCRPACAAGQRCKQGTCRCDNGGTVCGASCCRIGQECRGGQCVELPEPGQCIAFGQPCGQDTGLGCCDGLACASGQGGKGDVACWKPAGAACAATAECSYGNTCQNGACVADPPPPPQPEPGPGPAPDPPPPSCAATGGDKTTAGGYTIHTFTESGTLTFSAACSDVEYLVVGQGGNGGSGGGSGTGHPGGGGGGGAVLAGTLPTVPAGDVDVVVESFGKSSISSMSTPPSFDPIATDFYLSQIGGTGADEGGAASGGNFGNYMGGFGAGGAGGAGGGGGGGGASGSESGNGQPSSSAAGGAAGAGFTSDISGTAKVYGAGGAGGPRSNSTIHGAAGVNPGDGGGGGSNRGNFVASFGGGGAGAPGIVIVRYRAG